MTDFFMDVDFFQSEPLNKRVSDVKFRCNEFGQICAQNSVNI